MKKFLLPAIALSVSIFAFSLLVPSGASAASTPKPKTGTSKTETYMVIKVIDENKEENKVEYRAVATSRYKDEEKRVKDDNAKKIKEWKDLLKTEPNTPRPKKIVIKKIPKLTDYQLMEDAQKAADKLKDEELDKDNGDQKPKDTRR